MPGASVWITANIAWIVAALAAVSLLALGVAVGLAARLFRVEQHYRRLIAGSDGGNLQQVLDAHLSAQAAAQAQIQQLDLLARGIERGSRRHMQRFGFVRFNPFRDAGGDQSFSLALTDQDGNGLVMSSLHSRDATRIYGKPLVSWDSVYPLADEEKQAIEMAKAHH